MLGLNYLAWLGILVWIVVPALAWLTAWLIRRRARTALMRGMGVGVGLAILSAPWLVSSGVKAYYDRQVRELCAKDGGVRVYETVRLPADEYDQYAKRNWMFPDKQKIRLSGNYYIETDRHFYIKGYLNFVRTHHRIIRRIDGKILGESIRYGRAGGDLPGPWHHSSYMCPDPVKQPSNFETEVFVRGEEQ